MLEYLGLIGCAATAVPLVPGEGSVAAHVAEEGSHFLFLVGGTQGSRDSAEERERRPSS